LIINIKWNRKGPVIFEEVTTSTLEAIKVNIDLLIILRLSIQ